MSFVPLTGPATFEAVEPARDSVVVFTDAHRSVSLPIRAALPVLTRAHRSEDAHPTVGLLSGAVLLAMRLVAAGKLEPDDRAGWRIAPLDADDRDRLDRLVEARATGRRRPRPAGPLGDGRRRRRDAAFAVHGRLHRTPGHRRAPGPGHPAICPPGGVAGVR